MEFSYPMLSVGLGFSATALVACSSSSPATATDAGTNVPATGYAIVSASGALTAIAGDALSLKVVQTVSDGTTVALASKAVAWTAPGTAAALDPDSRTDSPLPAAGAQATGTFLESGRTGRATVLPGGVVRAGSPHVGEWHDRRDHLRVPEDPIEVVAARG